MTKVKGIGGNARSVLNALQPRKGVITTQSFLRLEKEVTTQSSINFDVLNNQGAQTILEKRLAITDSFVITGLSMLFYTYDTLTAGAQERSRLHSWPNPLVFTGAGEAASLQTFYNSYLSIRVNSVVFLDSLDMYRFYRAGVAQEALQITAVPSAYGADTWDSGDYSFYSMTPTIELSGATKNEISVTLPANVTSTPAANFKTYIVCYLRGFLRQNNAQFNPRG